MEIHNDTDHLPEFQNAVITIGAFDGVHKGHLQILQQLTAVAKHVNGTAVVITFFPHPKMVVQQDQYKIQLLNTLSEKIELFEKAGIAHLVIIPFSPAFAEMEASAYITDFLVKKFKPHSIIIGYDHRFGKNRTGDIRLLQNLSYSHHYKLIEIPEHILQNISISSTRIRHLLQEGDAVAASELLGYSYFFSGTVAHGEKKGRWLGFPTANLEPVNEDKLIPGNGVYAVTVGIEEEVISYKGMMNIGYRPTFQGVKSTIEVHLFDFNDDLYGKTLRVHLVNKIREEIKFEGIEALQAQLHQDRTNALLMLADK